MARYGDLDSVKLKVQRYLIPNTDIDGTVNCADAERWFLKLLDEEPTADIAPKSEGKWKPYKDYFTHRQIGWICTNCSSVIPDSSNGDTDYCPHCGAVMETESEEEDE